MANGRSALVNPRRRLPEMSLPTAPGGEPVRLRTGRRRAPVLVLTHGGACPACARYVAALAARNDEIAEWDGRVLVVHPGPPDDAAAFSRPDGFPVLVDADGRLSSALGARAPTIVVADQWGEIHEQHDAGEAHDFLQADEVVEWARFLAVQCPECQGEAF